MISSKRKHISGDKPPAMTLKMLPDELLLEILSWLPGKPVGRCKCVCKLWRSLIRSRQFTERYRKRHRGLLLYWPEFYREGDFSARFRFFHCPFRRPVEQLEKFSPLSVLEIGKDNGPKTHRYRLSQFVNGLVCVGEEDKGTKYLSLTLHNICTGEKMRIPDGLAVDDTHSRYHFGYDPVSRVYKLLRLIFRDLDCSIHGAHILNLRPPSDSLSTWRELDYNAAGICNLQFVCNDFLSEEKTSPDDGMLCWSQVCLSQGIKHLAFFDLNRESFWFVEHPVARSGPEMEEFHYLNRAITRFNDSLVIWFSSLEDDFSGLFCYIQEGKNWRKKYVEFSKEFKSFAIESRNHPSFSSRGEMLLMNPDNSWRVYSYARRHAEHTEKEDVFFVGQLPNKASCLSYISLYHSWDGFYPCPVSSVISFSESNNLYQSLDDVLGAGSATM